MRRLLFYLATLCFAGLHLATASPYAYLTAYYSPSGPVIPNADKVSVLNWQTGKLVTTIALKSAATLTAANPNGKFVYIIDGPAGQQEVSVISSATNAVAETFPITNDVTKTFVWHAAFLAVSPDGNTIWVGNGNNTVSIYCAKSYVLLAKITLPLPGGYTPSFVFSPDGTRAYIPYSNINSSVGTPAIIVLSTITRKVLKTLTPSVPFYYAVKTISRDGRFLYVTNAGDVYVISTADGSTLTVIPDIASSPQPITISSNGQQLWFGSSVSEVSGDESEVDVADTASNGIIKRFLAMTPVSLAITPDNKFAWVLQPSNSITRVSTSSFEIGRPIALPASPPVGSIVFVE